MNPIKKVLVTLLAGIFVIVAVAGCGSNAPATETQAEITSPEEVVSTKEAVSTEEADSTEETPENSTDTETTHSITSKTMPYHFMMVSDYTSSTVEVYFIDGSDVPYIEVEDWPKFQDSAITMVADTANYALTFSKEGDIVRATRDNGTSVTINFLTDIMEFDDYNGFLIAEDINLLDVRMLPKKDEEGNPLYLKPLDSSVRKYGHNKIMDLGYYDIDLVHEDDKYYIPLQTLSDIFMQSYGKTVIYNGECVFIYTQSPELFKNEDGTLSPSGEAVFGVDNEYSTGVVSEAMAKFNYDELCFAFDNIYGLKDSHHILGFRELVREMGYEDVFLGTDSRKIDEALCRIIADAIDDKHSKYLLASYASGIDYRDELIEQYGEGRGRTAIFELLDEYQAERAKYYPDGVPDYEEIGDTAFITFDEFKFSSRNYYLDPPKPEEADTVSIISRAVQQILRPGSPVKNVVLDLSCNTGGDVEAATYTISAFLGIASISEEDPNTGAQATNDYFADTNFDKKYDENDTLAGKGLNLYCLESGISFSCGNLVPAVFKEDPHVALIGQRSSGGSCSITFLSTALGSSLRLSSSRRVSYLRNGSFYDIDQGVEPDIFIANTESFFNRENLARYIDELL